LQKKEAAKTFPKKLTGVTDFWARRRTATGPPRDHVETSAFDCAPRNHRFQLTRNKQRTMFFFRSFGEASKMIRAVVEEAVAIASISLFVGMIAVWAHVLSIL
jgi:hypothetical protein